MIFDRCSKIPNSFVQYLVCTEEAVQAASAQHIAVESTESGENSVQSQVSTVLFFRVNSVFYSYTYTYKSVQLHLNYISFAFKSSNCFFLTHLFCSVSCVRRGNSVCTAYCSGEYRVWRIFCTVSDRRAVSSDYHWGKKAQKKRKQGNINSQEDCCPAVNNIAGHNR